MSLVHRAEASAVLKDAFVDAARGEGRVVLVTAGLAGGKTALLEQFRGQAAEYGALVLAATGARVELPTRLGLINQLFRDPALTRDVAERAGRLLAAQPATVPADAPVVRALGDLLLSVANSATVVIGIDDVHFADDASRQVLRYLCSRLNGTRILLILTEWARQQPIRPLFRTELATLPHSHLNLPPLSLDGVAELVGACGVAPVSVATVRDCYAVTGGNPLLVRAIANDTLDAQSDGEATVGAAYREAVLSCLHRWEPRLLMVARAVAVLDQYATVDRVMRLTGLEAPAISSVLDVLTTAGLLTDTTFRHEQGAVAVLDGIPAADRASMHVRAAEILHQDEVDARAVTKHLIAGEAVPDGWAVDVLRQSAERALLDDTVDLAVDALELALSACQDGPERTAIVMSLARALWRIDPAAAGLHLVPLLESTEDGSLGSADAATVVRHLLWQGAVHEYPTALKSAVDSAAVLFRLGHRWIYGSRTDLCDAAGSAPWIEDALSLHDALYEGGRDEVVEHADHILRNCQLGDTTLEVIALALTALLHVDEPELAAHWCDVLLYEAVRRGAATWEAVLTAIRADIALRQGDAEFAGAMAMRALGLLPTSGWGVLIGLPLSVRLTAATVLGRLDEAADLLKHVVPAAMYDTLLGMRYLRARGQYYLATGEVLAAVADFGQIRAKAVAWDLDLPELLPWRSDLAEAHLRIGSGELALALATEQLKMSRTKRSRGLSTRIVAACSELRQRPALIDTAIDVLQECGDRLELARAIKQLSRTYDELGDVSRARIVALSSDQESNLPLQQVVAREPASRTAEPVAGPGPAALSGAELRVAQLAASGHTNREIGQRLNITASTVEQHLTRVYRKLKVQRRAELPERLSALAAEPTSANTGW